MRSALTLALAVILLGGCERIFVSTDAEFSEVDVACLDSAIRGVAGVSGVDHRIDTGEALKSASTDGKVMTQSHWWTYHSKEPAYIRVARDRDHWEFTSTAMQWGTPWTSVELETFSPEMSNMHEALRRKCGLPIPKEVTVMRD